MLVLIAANRTVTITPGATSVFATRATDSMWTAAAALVGRECRLGLLLQKGEPQHRSQWFGIV